MISGELLSPVETVVRRPLPGWDAEILQDWRQVAGRLPRRDDPAAFAMYSGAGSCVNGAALVCVLAGSTPKAAVLTRLNLKAVASSVLSGGGGNCRALLFQPYVNFARLLRLTGRAARALQMMHELRNSSRRSGRTAIAGIEIEPADWRGLAFNGARIGDFVETACTVEIVKCLIACGEYEQLRELTASDVPASELARLVYREANVIAWTAVGPGDALARADALLREATPYEKAVLLVHRTELLTACGRPADAARLAARLLRELTTGGASPSTFRLKLLRRVLQVIGAPEEHARCGVDAALDLARRMGDVMLLCDVLSIASRLHDGGPRHDEIMRELRSVSRSSGYAALRRYCAGEAPLAWSVEPLYREVGSTLRELSAYRATTVLNDEGNSWNRSR